MKLSEHTLKILKNYASINPSILIRTGSLLSTRSINGVIGSEAPIDEEFPVEFAVYDLAEFLNTLKLFKSPVLDFSSAEETNQVKVCEEEDLNFKVKYTFYTKEFIKYPEGRPNFGTGDIEFFLSEDVLASIMKSSTVMQLPNVMIMPGEDRDHIRIAVADLKNPSSNTFSVVVDAEVTPEVKDYKLIFKMEYFKMLPGAYNVTVSGKRSARFESDLVDYYIGQELASRF